MKDEFVPKTPRFMVMQSKTRAVHGVDMILWTYRQLKDEWICKAGMGVTGKRDIQLETLTSDASHLCDEGKHVVLKDSSKFQCM